MAKLILQLSDLHLFKTPQQTIMKVNPAAALEKVIAKICDDYADNKPDLAIISGDLTQDGSLESYQLAYSMLRRLSVPCVALPGNHDEEIYLKQVFLSPKQTVIPFASPIWTLLGLNTQFKGAAYGIIRQEEWQAVTTLVEKNPKRHFVLFLHHHLLPCGSHWLDKINVHRAAPFLDFIRAHPNLRAVFGGHVHQELTQSSGDTKFYAVPAIGWQFAKHQQTFKLGDTMPGYRLIRLHQNGKIETTVNYLSFDPQFIPDTTVTGY